MGTTDTSAASMPGPSSLAVRRQVVLCADDYGMSAGVSEAILTLARHQRLSATSAMVLSPRWREDARPLAEFKGAIDVGLHLDWTSDFAKAAGHGLALGAAMRRAVLGGFNRALARTEIERQLDAFESAWGAPPDHIDGHQHVQQFAGIRQVLIEVMAKRYGPHAADSALPWVRVSRPEALQSDLKGKVIAALGATALTRLGQQHGVPVSTVLSGIYGFDSSPGTYARHMSSWLTTAPDKALLMCHPSSQRDDDDEINPARLCEFKYLNSAAFPETLRAKGVALARGSTIYTARSG